MTHDILCEDLSTELEQEYFSRIEEINKIENFFESNRADNNEDLADIMRKSLILLLYAHFEGFCKQAFQSYIIYINKEQIPISSVKAGLAAANMNSAFQKLFDTNYKPVMINTYSSDGAIQLHGRKREFIMSYDTSLAQEMSLGEEFINTEANLYPDVLRKILFQLDLDSSLIDAYQGQIHKLVNIRNSFAHGGRDRPPTQNEYNDYKQAALDTMRNVKSIVEAAFFNRSYLKAV